MKHDAGCEFYFGLLFDPDYDGGCRCAEREREARRDRVVSTIAWLWVTVPVVLIFIAYLLYMLTR